MIVIEPMDKKRKKNRSKSYARYIQFVKLHALWKSYNSRRKREHDVSRRDWAVETRYNERVYTMYIIYVYKMAGWSMDADNDFNAEYGEWKV